MFGASPLDAASFFFRDPVHTKATRVSDGVEYRGAWAMTQGQKSEVDRIMGENEGMEFKAAAETVGARWDGYCESVPAS